MIEMNHIFTTTMMKHVLASVALMLITTAPTTQAAPAIDWMGTLAAIITWITSPCYSTA